MPGHVFVVRGDIRRLDCDAWLVPCGGQARPLKFLPPHLPEVDRWPGPPPESGSALMRPDGLRVHPVPAWPANEPRAWLVNVGGVSGTPAEWYFEGLRQALAAVLPPLLGSRPRSNRPKPLLALPVLGVGKGRFEDIGAAVGGLLDVLYAAAGKAEVDFA